MSAPMDVDEVPPALQQETLNDQGDVSKVKGKAKDVGEKKRFEVKKVQHNASVNAQPCVSQ